MLGREPERTREQVAVPNRVRPAVLRLEEARALPPTRSAAARPGARRDELPLELGGGDKGADRSPAVPLARPWMTTPSGGGRLAGAFRGRRGTRLRRPTASTSSYSTTQGGACGRQRERAGAGHDDWLLGEKDVDISSRSKKALS